MTCECSTSGSNKSNSCFDKNLSILLYKKWFVFVVIFLISFIYFFCTYYFIIPYILTGDINKIFQIDNMRNSKKIIMLINSFAYFFYFPAMTSMFYNGNIHIHFDRIELHPFLKIFRKRIIYYNNANIIQKSLGMKIAKNEAISLLNNPYKYWKNMYWDSINVPLYPSVLSNPYDLEFSINFLKEKIENKIIER